MKKCRVCHLLKPLDEFYRNKNRKDGRQGECNLCQSVRAKNYYATTGYQKEIRYAWKEENLRKNREYVFNFLNAHPCLDCGTTDWRVLEFDHVNGEKVKSITEAIRSWALPKLIQEIDKCEVRCKNCHAIVTYERAGTWRSWAV